MLRKAVEFVGVDSFHHCEKYTCKSQDMLSQTPKLSKFSTQFFSSYIA